jgi:hypothetical protein
MEILQYRKIPLSTADVRRRLRLKKNQSLEAVERLLDTAHSLMAIHTVYDVAYIEEKGPAHVRVNSLVLRSKVLRRNLQSAERIFPFVITLGERFDAALHEWPDLLEKFYLDAIGSAALAAARKLLANHLCQKFALEGLASMAPGSLEDWPINEQRQVFALLGDVDAAVGVQLTSSLLMVPTKSVSGVFFPTRESFVSCQLCPRENCPSRKARYSEEKAREYGILDH